MEEIWRRNSLGLLCGHRTFILCCVEQTDISKLSHCENNGKHREDHWNFAPEKDSRHTWNFHFLHYLVGIIGHVNIDTYWLSMVINLRNREIVLVNIIIKQGVLLFSHWILDFDRVNWWTSQIYMDCCPCRFSFVQVMLIWVLNSSGFHQSSWAFARSSQITWIVVVTVCWCTSQHARKHKWGYRAGLLMRILRLLTRTLQGQLDVDRLVTDRHLWALCKRAHRCGMLGSCFDLMDPILALKWSLKSI